MKKNLRTILGILISLAFLYLAMRSIDWDKLLALLRQARYWWLVPAGLLIALISWIRGYRWWLLLGSPPELSRYRLFNYVNIGYFFNNVLPAKAGELARAYLAGRAIPDGIGQALSSILIERLLDVLCAVLLLVFLIPVVALPGLIIKAGVTLGIVVIVGVVVLIALSIYGERGVDWLFGKLERLPLLSSPRLAPLVDKVKDLVVHLVEGFGVLTGKTADAGGGVSRNRLPAILLSSVAVWGGYWLLNYIFTLTFNMTGLPPAAPALVLCATGLSMVIPSSPGAVGPFEWAAAEALSVFGVDGSQAYGYAFGLHIYTNLVLIALGAIALVLEGVSWKAIKRGAESDGVQ
jgi:hypothetical protein